MRLKELKEKADFIISDLKDNGNFPKENNILDYKYKLNVDSKKSAEENFLVNFAKDITSFSNGDGGIILLGFEENKNECTISDTGLDLTSLEILERIDLNLITQKFEKIAKIGISLDLQSFRISSRKFFYILIEKGSNILVPQQDFPDFKLFKGEIFYRASGKNEHANKTTADFNRFLQIKANEKNKEFMDIWSKLLPEMFDINPREVLILNPKNNKVYGYNAKENQLATSDIDIDQTENGIFNIILNAISAGEIGKISTDEGKPIYKIVGELSSKTPREFIYFSNLNQKVKEQSNFNFTTNQLKFVFKYLKWVTDEKLPIENPSEHMVVELYNHCIWIEILDRTHKVVFSEQAVKPLVDAINEKKNHLSIFGKLLQPKTTKKK